MSQSAPALPPESKLSVAALKGRLGQHRAWQIQIPSPLVATVVAVVAAKTNLLHVRVNRALQSLVVRLA